MWDPKELASLAEQARSRLLAQPRESVWDAVRREPFAMLFIPFLYLPLYGGAVNLLDIIVERVFSTSLLDSRGASIILLLAWPIPYLIWVDRDVRKKYEARMAAYPKALPSSIAKMYCKAFSERDRVWDAMDHLWRTAEMLSRAQFGMMLGESSERAMLSRNAGDDGIGSLSSSGDDSPDVEPAPEEPPDWAMRNPWVSGPDGSSDVNGADEASPDDIPF